MLRIYDKDFKLITSTEFTQGNLTRLGYRYVYIFNVGNLAILELDDIYLCYDTTDRGGYSELEYKKIIKNEYLYRLAAGTDETYLNNLISMTGYNYEDL